MGYVHITFYILIFCNVITVYANMRRVFHSRKTNHFSIIFFIIRSTEYEFFNELLNIALILCKILSLNFSFVHLIAHFNLSSTGYCHSHEEYIRIQRLCEPTSITENERVRKWVSCTSWKKTSSTDQIF